MAKPKEISALGKELKGLEIRVINSLDRGVRTPPEPPEPSKPGVRKVRNPSGLPEPPEPRPSPPPPPNPTSALMAGLFNSLFVNLVVAADAADLVLGFQRARGWPCK